MTFCPLLEKSNTALMLCVIALAAVTVIGFSSEQEAFAATVTWDGETDGNWATGANWVGNVAPGDGDDVVLVDAANDPTNNNLVGVQLNSVTISSVDPLIGLTIGGNPIELQSGGSITVNYPENLVDVVFNSGVTLNGDATITVLDGFVEFHGAAITGTGPLTLVNHGGLDLNVPNNYTGATTIGGSVFVHAVVNGAIPTGSAVTLNAGLRSSDDMELGSLAGTGTVNVNFGNTLTVGGDNTDTLFSGVYMAGTGANSLVKTGTGTLTLTGNSFYSGGTTIEGGALAVSSDSNLGDSAGGLVFDGGTLQYNAGFSSARSVTLNAGGGTIDTNGNAATLSGVISGTGELTKTGTGTLTLTGNNTYTGGTTVSGGTLQGTTTSLQGNIENNAAVIFDQSSDDTYADVISGTGSLTKTGSGTVILSGANTYTGATTVIAGTLIVDGSTAAGTIITVESGATLDGTGTINGNIVLEHGATLGAGLTILGSVNPLADDQSVTTDEDQALTITLTGSDGNSDPLTFFIQVLPENGTLAFTGTNSSVTYTPNGNFSGNDSFTFVANDGTVDSAPATISITISAANDAPVTNAQTVTVDEDEDVEITLTGSDIDNDPLMFVIVTQPENGALAAIGTNTTTSAKLTYTPNANFNGADSFTFVVNDGSVNSAAATVSITVNPVAEPDDDDDDDRRRGGGGGGGKRVVIIYNNQQQGGSSVTTYPESHFADNPLGRIGVSNSGLIDAFDASIDLTAVGQQVSITGTLSNHQQVAQDYAFIVQITDRDGTVVFIGSQQGNIESGMTADISLSWTPEAAGDYTVKIFVWDGLQTPAQPLSAVTAMNIEVTG